MDQLEPLDSVVATDRLISCTTLRAGLVRDELGEVLTAAQFSRRVAWALDLESAAVASLLTQHYTAEDLTVLGAGYGPDDRRLPSSAYMAARRLGWGLGPVETSTGDLYLPDRFRRMIEESAVRRLRQALWTEAVLSAITSTWPQGAMRTEDEWKALNKALPPGTDKVTVRNRGRQVKKFLGEHGRLPSHLVDLEPVATAGPALLLGAADKQMSVLTRTSTETALLRVKLPSVAAPRRRADWAFVSVCVALPGYLAVGAELGAPTLRLVSGRVVIDQPYSEAVVKPRGSGHVVALGFDWGVNTLLTASLGYLDDDGHVFTDGKPMSFDASPVTAKITRLRKQREVLATKIDHANVLLASATRLDVVVALEKKIAVWHREITHINARQKHLNKALATTAARWLVDQALANSATVIYAEDLASMEPTGMGKIVNSKCANAVRSHLLTMTRHLAARAGITVVLVPARGTSSQCPRCLSALTHLTSPRGTQPGHAWAVCEACGFSGDRDHSASERIISRGLVSQHLVKPQRASGHLEVRQAVDSPVRRRLRPRVKPLAGQGSRRQARYARSAVTTRVQNKRPRSVAAAPAITTPTSATSISVPSRAVSPRARLRARTPATPGISPVYQRSAGTHQTRRTFGSTNEVDYKVAYGPGGLSPGPSHRGFPQRICATRVVTRHPWRAAHGHPVVTTQLGLLPSCA